MKIIAIGRNEIFFDVVTELSKKHQIAGIITSTASPEYLKNEEDLKMLAKSLNCPFLITKKEKEIMNLVKKVRPDIGVSINWISILSKDILDLIPKGVLNCHPGDLPKYRGNAATNWALLFEETSIVFTVHNMVADYVDKGDIYMQKKMLINDETTISDINNYWRKIAPGLFLKVIAGIESGKLHPQKQGGNGFRCYPRLLIDSKIDWNRSTRYIHSLVRSSTKPYSGAYSFMKINEKIEKVYIWKTRIVAETTADIGIPGHIISNNEINGETYVYCGEGIIALQEVQFESGETFQPGTKWKSIRMNFGIDVEDEIRKLHNLLQ